MLVDYIWKSYTVSDPNSNHITNTLYYDNDLGINIDSNKSRNNNDNGNHYENDISNGHDSYDNISKGVIMMMIIE